MAGIEEKRVFIHHMDTFEMNEIKKILIEENLEQNCSKYEILGTVWQPENMYKGMHSRHPLRILNSEMSDYIERIVESDVMIFNSGSLNFENVCIDIRRVIVALEEWTAAQKKLIEPDANPEKKKHLILVSTPMTWAMSETEITEEEEELIEDFLYEDDYRRRKAHRGYCKHKLLERDVIWVQKKCKHFVNSLVVCPGVIYGEENSTFHYIFKLSFYNQIVPILRPGNQNIPIIYIKDYAQIMKNIIDDFPEAKVRYIFAVQPHRLTLKSFTYKICKALNEDCSRVRFYREVEMLMMDRDLLPQSTLDLLSLDIKLVPTYLKNFAFHKLSEEFWLNITQEFRDARNLRPLKIVIDGPPLVGKTEHARRLAKHYNLIYIGIRDIVYEYIRYLEEQIENSLAFVEEFKCPERTVDYEMYEWDDDDNTPKFSHIFEPLQSSEEDTVIIAEMKNSIEEWTKQLFNLQVYVASHKTFENQDNGKISKCLISLLSTKLYNKNQGYIIDGFPFNYEQANDIYFNTKEIKEPKVTSSSDQPDDHILVPTHFIVFDATDEVLCERAMAFTETEAIRRRCLRHQMLPRLDEYRERNDDPQCLTNLFYDNDLIPIHVYVDSNTVAGDTLRNLKATIGNSFTYPLTPEQQKALDQAMEEARIKEEEEQRRKKEDLLKVLTYERERKLLNWTAKYEELRKHEYEMREVKTLPLRQYLGKYILPTLTQGILKIAELKPADPVDFLAEYLFKFNPDGQQMPPFCTEEQKKRFYDIFKDDLSIDSEYECIQSTCKQTQQNQ